MTVYQRLQLLGDPKVSTCIHFCRALGWLPRPATWGSQGINLYPFLWGLGTAAEAAIPKSWHVTAKSSPLQKFWPTPQGGKPPEPKLASENPDLCWFGWCHKKKKNRKTVPSNHKSWHGHMGRQLVQMITVRIICQVNAKIITICGKKNITWNFYAWIMNDTQIKKKARVKTVVQTWTLSHPNGDRWVLLDYPCDTTPLYSHWNGMVIKNINRLLGQPKSHHPIVIPINRLMVDVYGNGNINGNQNPTGYLDKMQWGHGVSWQREYISHVHCDHGPSKYTVPVGSIDIHRGSHAFVGPISSCTLAEPIHWISWVWGPNSCI